MAVDSEDRGRRASSAALLGTLLLAAGLRFARFDHVPPNPFYDAAVRSMGLSWHNLFYGAFEPGGQVSIDKTPVDLWLQVASTKLLGFSSVSLRLPQAIAGTLAIALLYDLVRRGFGRPAGLTAALALAVSPVAVLTSRSDTMDTVLGTLLLLAAWIITRARPEHQHRAVIGAGAIAGLAFEVKLFQALIALPALALLATLTLTPRRRAKTLALAAFAFLATATAWPLAATLAPGPHPYPIGSTDGTVANVILVFNGLDRLGYPGPGSSGLASPGPLRLLSTQPPGYLGLIGVELAAALLVGALALAASRRRPAASRVAGWRLRRAVGAGVATWLATGFVLFSVQGRLRIRYLEAFTPAIAAAVGIGLTLLVGHVVRRMGWSPARGIRIIATVLVALLAWPLATSVGLVRRGAEDSQTLGAMPATPLASLHRYLAGHQSGVRYELASSRATIAGPLIVRDAQPVLMLTTWQGRPLTTPASLAAKVRAGEVRHLLLDETGCRSRGAPSCLPSVRWALAHSTDVTRAAGLEPGRVLVRFDAPAAG